MSAIEIVGVVLGLATVWLTARQNVWCWPVGILNAVCFAFMFVGTRLYADAGLQVVFVVLSAYGWYSWSRPKAELPVVHFPGAGWLASVAVLAVGTLTLGSLLSRTDAALPWANAATAVASLIAQWMMTRKILESWFVWIVADVAMIAVYFHQRLYLTGALYVVFIALCVTGFIGWKKSMRPAPASAPATA